MHVLFIVLYWILMIIAILLYLVPILLLFSSPKKFKSGDLVISMIVAIVATLLIYAADKVSNIGTSSL